MVSQDGKSFVCVMGVVLQVEPSDLFGDENYKFLIRSSGRSGLLEGVADLSP